MAKHKPSPKEKFTNIVAFLLAPAIGVGSWAYRFFSKPTNPDEPTISNSSTEDPAPADSITETSYVKYAYGVENIAKVTIEKSTDTLYGIAEEYHTDVDTIVDMNKDRHPSLKDNPSIIKIGWVLIVPDNRPKVEITENKNEAPTSNSIAPENGMPLESTDVYNDPENNKPRSR